jgi:RNA recognition motif-containing protein
VKDLFKDAVGPIAYVNLFKDEGNNSRGCGIIEFEKSEDAKKAVEKMHRHDFKGRKLVVKEDFDVERDKFGRIITDGSKGVRGGGGGGPRRTVGRDDRMNPRGGGGGGGSGIVGNTYGLSVGFLNSLGIDGPLNSRLFIANVSGPQENCASFLTL